MGICVWLLHLAQQKSLNNNCLHLLLLLLLALLSTMEAVQQSFVEEPGDLSVVKGANVILPCIVKMKMGMIQWTRDSFGLGIEREMKGFPRYKMIGNDKQGNYSLKIADVNLEDDAVFQCQVGAADNIRGIRSRNSKLTVLVPPEPPLIVQGSFLQITAGVKVILECDSHGGKPAAELKWLDGSVAIKSGVEHETEQLSDGKRFNSKLKWTFTPNKAHDDPPDVGLTVDSIKINEHDEVKFTCLATANPNQLTYKWYRNDEVIMGDFTTSLIIPKVTIDFHNTAISCKVINAVGTTKKTHTLNIHYGPRFKTLPNNVAADEGTDVTLKCDVDGNPTPNVIWTLENSKKVISLKKSLTITNVDVNKTGRYKCWATVTGFPPIVGQYRILVKGPPQLVAVRDQFGLQDETVKITCSAISVPQPTRVLWTHNDREIDAERSSRFEMHQDPTEDGVKNILLVHQATDDDFGDYNCTVWNDFGQDSIEITLHKQKSLFLMIILAAVLGGIAVIVSVTVVIVLCIRRYHKTPGIDDDQEPEKQSKTSEHSSNDSDLKVDIRTSSSMSNNGSEPWDENSEDSKQRTSNAAHDLSRYSNEFIDDIHFPSNVEAHNNNGYIPYVDYQRDYTPPTTFAIINTSQTLTNGVDSRYSYLRNNSSNLHQTQPTTTFTVGRATPAAQVPRPHNESQYIMAPQVPIRSGTLATHV
uniref:Ig-like domain-containing protein n=1 Tax=Strigamia maritima TaxID=126957 RepID=T1IW82_STRMM